MQQGEGLNLSLAGFPRPRLVYDSGVVGSEDAGGEGVIFWIMHRPCDKLPKRQLPTGGWATPTYAAYAAVKPHFCSRDLSKPSDFKAFSAVSNGAPGFRRPRNIVI
jgi:hypothetical protein